MTPEQEAALAALDQRVRSNARRIEGLERGQEALNRLATAVEVLAAKQTAMDENLRRITGELDTLEQRPARRWEALTDKILLALAGAFVTFLLTR
jgi:predicted nuclease with TOPRIM domain